ncbi:MAG: sulfatase [Sedimentisphaerales bacterium]|nr:sulfatase [Sedimentisphaerales bacterium]
MLNRRNFLSSTGFTVATILLGSGLIKGAQPAGKKRPNFLIIMADDCTYNDLPVYGGRNALTPNLDKLASQSMVFYRAYLGSAMCQPCRAELYSGLYPMSNGCAWNHSASRPDITTMPHHLGDLGYRVGLTGKVHVLPKKAFPFEMVPGFDTNCVRDPTRPHEVAGIRRFMSRSEDQPFCLVVALVEPHVPWVMGDPSKYPPEKIKLPPNIADTPTTRQAYARYLAEIAFMDSQVGEILDILESTGKADDTFVLFTSEQGAQFPGCKWTNWDTGLHTALMARWPGRVPPGKRTNALVQYTDVLPTLVEAAGGKPFTHRYDGTSFLPVLLGTKSDHRNYVYGSHNNIPEGPAYPVRTVSDGQYRYIRNLRSDEIYIEKHLMGWSGDGKLNNPYWATWIGDAWNDPHTYDLVKRYMHRPPEELYDTENDPYEMKNLADDPSFSPLKASLRSELDRWMTQQGDPGAPQDTHEAIEAARQGMHLYGPQNKK